MNAIPTAAVTRTIAAVGAGLAIATTARHFAIVLGYPAITARLPAPGAPGFAVRVVYEDGRGIPREVLGESSGAGSRCSGRGRTSSRRGPSGACRPSP